jgi:hypothetical protein
MVVCVKELVYAGRAVLVGDEAADAVVDYAAVLARMRSADSVELEALTEDRRPVRVYYVLGNVAPVMAQTIEIDEAEPDNASQVGYMRAALRRLDPDLMDTALTDAALMSTASSRFGRRD